MSPRTLLVVHAGVLTHGSVLSVAVSLLALGLGLLNVTLLEDLSDNILSLLSTKLVMQVLLRGAVQLSLGSVPNEDVSLWLFFEY